VLRFPLVRDLTVNRARWSALLDLFLRIERNKSLLGEMMRREVRERTAGQALGWIWIVAQPVLTTAAYILVFGVLFRSASDVGGGRQIAFLLAGLLPWVAASDLLGRATFAITGSAGFVKQIVFPVELLVLRFAGPLAITLGVSLAFYVGYLMWVGHGPKWMWFALPIAIFGYLCLIVGLGLAIAAVSVFVRDIRDITNLYLTVGLFFSPILYDISYVPSAMRWIIFINPITPVVLAFQDVFFYGAFAHPWAWVFAGVWGLLSLELGFGLFRLLRPLMSDAL